MEELIEKVYKVLRYNPNYYDVEIDTLCQVRGCCCYEIYDMLTNGETMKVAKMLVEENIVTKEYFD